MARSDRLIVAGASGVFGRLLARELCLRSSAEVVLAGRDLATLEAVRKTLPAGSRHSALRLDLLDPDAVARAAASSSIILCTAGPFQSLDLAAVRGCVDAGAHWLDISDDSPWTTALLGDSELNAAAEARGVTVMSGLSTLPAISCSLVRRLLAQDQEARSSRATLFIGNRNAKGKAAMISAMAGAAEPTRIALPVGSFRAFPLSVPDRDLLAADPGIDAEGFVAFESPLASLAFRILRTIDLSLRWRERVASVVSRLTVISRFGSDRSCLQVETFANGTRRARIALLARGQLLAVLPILFTALRLREGLGKAGCVRPDSFAVDLLDFLQRENIEFFSEEGRAE